MSEPVSVDAAHFFEFIDRPGLAVLFVSVHPRHTFSDALARQLASEHPDIALGTISVIDLMSSGGAAAAYLNEGFRACGVSTVGALPGYCLFRQAQMLAWDSGLPSLAELEVFGRSALVGVVFSGLTNNLSFIVQAMQVAFDQTAAHRVSRVFREAAAQRTYRRSGSSSSAPAADEVQWAYDVLSVRPTATDREVHQAWRRLRIEMHPDAAAGDRAEFERRSRRSVDINRARDIIAAHRARSGADHARAA